jgi:hypothetical protein
MTDKERLDWLSVATVDDRVVVGYNRNLNEHRLYLGVRGDPDTIDVKSPHGLRAAIDAAMERERQG